LLFEQSVGKVDLLGDGSSVDLDFTDVSLLVSLDSFVDLSVGNNSDNGGVFLELFQSIVQQFRVLSVLLGVGSEELLL